MAKIEQGALGGFDGKLGPAVGFNWKGRACMRSMPSRYRDSNTRRQRHQRRLFAATTQLASRMLPAAKIGLRGPAADGQMSEMNYFIRLNKPCLTLEEGTVGIDYTRLRLAEGALPAVHFGTPRATDATRIGVDFRDDEADGGCATDYVYLYTYAPEEGQGVLSLPTYRSAGHVDLAVPASWTGTELHLYGFAWDRASTASDSRYLGSVTP